jgi:drug/metabolite transporter (DMT)-like permease
MLLPESIGILAALTSALIWGSGDFAGGMATRRSASSQVLWTASVTGVVVLLPLAILMREALPSMATVAWSSLAGLSGGLGILVLYRALSTGPAALVAPIAGVVGASVPVAVGALLEGQPTVGHQVGLLIGMGGIWFVSRGAGGQEGFSRRPWTQAALAGVAFGGFFVFMAQVRVGLLAPIVVAKLAASVLALGLLRIQRLPLRSGTPNFLALAAGVLDAGGNLFYLLAVQYARLDLAAVISSMYPAATVILARVVRHERTSLLQAIGIGLCLASVAVIAAA